MHALLQLNELMCHDQAQYWPIMGIMGIFGKTSKGSNMKVASHLLKDDHKINGNRYRPPVQPLIVWYKTKASCTAVCKCKPLNHAY